MSVGRRAAAALVLAAGSVIVSILIAEAALRIANPAPTVYRMLLPGNSVFHADARWVHGIEGPASYAVNDQGIRGPAFGPDAEEYRILLVGGSTTESALLDESENWGAIALRDLPTTLDGRRVWMGNVGRSGLTSRDHAVTVKYLLPQYPRIDLVVVLVGVNDLTVALRQGDSYRPLPPLTDPDAERVQIRNAFALSPGGLREMMTIDLVPAPVPWFKRTHIYQLGRRARVAWLARSVVQGVGGADIGQWRENRRSASSITDSLPDLTRPLADYRRNLELVVEYARNEGAEVMFLTQPTLWKQETTATEEALLWLGGTGNFQEEPGHEYYSPAALGVAMTQYNEQLLTTCRELQLSCLDLASRIPSDTTVFYDDVHFTEAGAVEVGRALSEHLRTSKPNLFAPVSPVRPE